MALKITSGSLVGVDYDRTYVMPEEEMSVTFDMDCLTAIDEVELNITILADKKQYDQKLDELLIGPIPVGLNRFTVPFKLLQFETLPAENIPGNVGLCFRFFYKGQMFTSISYLITVFYTDPELVAHPPAQVDRYSLYREFIMRNGKPLVTTIVKPIEWVGLGLSLEEQVKQEAVLEKAVIEVGDELLASKGLEQPEVSMELNKSNAAEFDNNVFGEDEDQGDDDDDDDTMENASDIESDDDATQEQHPELDQQQQQQHNPNKRSLEDEHLAEMREEEIAEDIPSEEEWSGDEEAYSYKADYAKFAQKEQEEHKNKKHKH